MIYIGEHTQLRIKFAWDNFEPVAASSDRVRVIDRRTRVVDASGVVDYGGLTPTLEKFCEAITIITEQGNECINY